MLTHKYESSQCAGESKTNVKLGAGGAGGRRGKHKVQVEK